MSIRRLRMSVKMTQKQLAKELNVSRTTVTMWELGYSLPCISLLPKMARVFKTSIENLVFAFIETTEKEEKNYASKY